MNSTTSVVVVVVIIVGTISIIIVIIIIITLAVLSRVEVSGHCGHTTSNNDSGGGKSRDDAVFRQVCKRDDDGDGSIVSENVMSTLGCTITSDECAGVGGDRQGVVGAIDSNDELVVLDLFGGDVKHELGGV